MNAAQKFNLNHNNVSIVLNTFQPQAIDNNKLEMLLADISIYGLDAFEQVHAMLYPLIFSYANLFSIDNKIIDQLLVDEFFYCWKNRRFTSGTELKIELIRRLRGKIEVILNIERKRNDLLPGRIDINQVLPQLLENEFLKRFMHLSDEDIAQINCKNAA